MESGEAAAESHWFDAGRVSNIQVVEKPAMYRPRDGEEANKARNGLP